MMPTHLVWVGHTVIGRRPTKLGIKPRVLLSPRLPVSFYHNLFIYSPTDLVVIVCCLPSADGRYKPCHVGSSPSRFELCRLAVVTRRPSDADSAQGSREETRTASGPTSPHFLVSSYLPKEPGVIVHVPRQQERTHYKAKVSGVGFP